ncbi:hypothetical protein BDR03DRAFT_974142 [Suillus americanus]|nr:hypothetical protein BDR03DRAFT_974142 [Suillus americanus]
MSVAGELFGTAGYNCVWILQVAIVGSCTSEAHVFGIQWLSSDTASSACMFSLSAVICWPIRRQLLSNASHVLPGAYGKSTPTQDHGAESSLSRSVLSGAQHGRRRIMGSSGDRSHFHV